MNEPMSATIFSENQVRLAEEHYEKGNVKEAIEIVNALTFSYPNTSANHSKISQVLVTYEINWTSLQDGVTHYDILRISNPFCCHQMVQRKYRDIMVKLCPSKNKSVAAKSAFAIINYAWKILSDHERRRDYNIEKRFQRRIVVSEDKPHQLVRQENRHCVEIIDDSDSN